MGFFKTLFGGSEPDPKEKEEADKAKFFDNLKYSGVSSLHEGQYEEAIKCFNKALEIKNDLEIHDYLSQAYIRNDEQETALEQLQILAESQPDNKQILIHMANVTYMLENYDKMLAICEKAETLDNDDAQIRYLHAQAFIGQGNVINAIAQLTKAITWKDDYADAYLLRGETLLKMGDVNGAGEDADWLMKHTKDVEDVLLLEARIKHAKGDLKESISYYNKVIEVNPFCVVAFKERGSVKLENGDKEGAEEDARQILEINPNEAEKVSGNYEAKGSEGGIQQKVEDAYKVNNPFGLG